MAQSPFRNRSTRPSSALLVALGAVAGVALGLLLARRVVGGDGMLPRGDRLDHRRGRRRAPEAADGHGHKGPTDAVDELADEFADEPELAGESIAHLHVRGRSGSGNDDAEAVSDRASTREQLRDRMRDRRTRSIEFEGAIGSDASAHAPSRPRTTPTVIPIGPSVPTHEALESRVLEAFHHDPVLEARAIDISAVGAGTIELTGWVESTGEIAHALTVARGVPGVTSVVDQLAVRGPDSIESHRLPQYETRHRR